MVDIQSPTAEIRRGEKRTRMRANAQRDGCPAKYRWRPKLCGVGHRAPPIFGRATITLGIGKKSPKIAISAVPRWRFLATFLRPVFQRAACNTFQTCILNSH